MLVLSRPLAATVVREKFNYPEVDWQAKREELEKEHNADGARESQGPAAGWLVAMAWQGCLSDCIRSGRAGEFGHSCHR